MRPLIQHEKLSSQGTANKNRMPPVGHHAQINPPGWAGKVWLEMLIMSSRNDIVCVLELGFMDALRTA